MWSPTISSELFLEVKKGYKLHVVQKVKTTLQENMDAAVKLGNYFLPSLRETLARQRRDYEISDEFPAQHPISALSDAQQQNAPCNNLKMENACGKVAYRVRKNKSLECTSRQIILEGTSELRQKRGDSFRTYKAPALQIKELKLKWSKKQDVIAGEKLSKKQKENLKVEGRVLKQLDYLKSVGGPFTSVEAVTAYLDSDDTDKKKAIRLKTEVQYARDTSTSLAKVNPLFRIRTQKIGDERARQLTCAEFATNIKKLISQKLGAVDKMITLQRFMSSLNT